jgi:probable HAF family extracellular repeat protein
MLTGAHRWLWIISLAIMPHPAANGEIRYQVTDLSLVVGGNRIARGINESGQVVGGPAGVSYGEAFLWDPEDGPRLLGTLHDLPLSDASGLNENGTVVGSIAGAVFVPVQHAFVWREETGMVDIGTLSYPTNLARAISVNDSDLVVGNSIGFVFVSPYEYFIISQGFIWDAGEGMRPLDGFREANAVNNAGQIVGQAFDPTPEDDSTGDRAVLLDPATGLQDLGVLPGTVSSSANDINESGQVVGWSGDFAFLWHDGTMSSLESGDLPITSARAINRHGMIVGFGQLLPNGSPGSELPTNRMALLWDGNALHKLNDLIDPVSGWHLELALDINDRGQIVGGGTHAQFPDRWRAFLLTPIPVPLRSDFDGDGDVDFDDFAFLSACRTGPAAGPPAPGCEGADLDGDGDVDHDDFGLFQRCFGRANQPPDPGCAG